MLKQLNGGGALLQVKRRSFFCQVKKKEVSGTVKSTDKLLKQMNLCCLKYICVFFLSDRTGGPNEASPSSPPSLASASPLSSSTRSDPTALMNKLIKAEWIILPGFVWCREFASVHVCVCLQAGALVHIYTDGSVLLTHGGTEMGQGLHTKMVQVPEINKLSRWFYLFSSSLIFTFFQFINPFFSRFSCCCFS